MNMRKPRKSAADLAERIMRELGADPAGANVAEVRVQTVGNNSQWEVRPIAKPGTSLSAECWARLRAVQHTLRQQFDLTDA